MFQQNLMKGTKGPKGPPPSNLKGLGGEILKDHSCFFEGMIPCFQCKLRQRWVISH